VAAAVVITAVWAFILLDRTPGFLPWLRWVILMAGVLAGCCVVAGPILAGRAVLRSRRGRLAQVLAPLGLALVAGLAGPTAYALDTISATHTGAIPSAGPQTTGLGGGPGGAAAGGGAGGGLGGSTQVSSALVKLLEQDASRYRWVAATEGSEAAAPLELATGDAVMAIGGFNGTDPWPTLAAFEKLVASHEVHYYLGQGIESFGGGRGSSAIAAWVAAHFKKLTVGGETVYDLTQPISGTV